jgi:predicted nucleic acid-binding protein
LQQAGGPTPTNDIWIAATAMEYGLIVVTTDDHYQKIPQIMVDYFAAV